MKYWKKASWLAALAAMLAMAPTLVSATADADSIASAPAAVAESVLDSMGMSDDDADAAVRARGWCWANHVSNQQYYSVCTRSTRTHRMHIKCESWWGSYWTSGPARYNNRQSWATCSWGGSVTSASVSAWY